MAASGGGGGDDSSIRKSIVIMEMPEEFINRDILKRHFEQFGSVERLACSVSKKYAVIHFSSVEEAENAAARGAMIRPDAPRLKIVNRGVGTVPSMSQKPSTAAAPPAASPPPPPPSRVVTKRKIIRNFNPPALESSPSVRTATSARDPLAGSSSASPSFQSQTPLRSSVKISRPSPFLRKKPSFGEKTARPAGSTGPRNPFALPSRGMLSLDRRKKPQEGRSAGTNPLESSSNVASSSRASTTSEESGFTGVSGSYTVTQIQSEAAPTLPAAEEDEGVPDPNTEEGEYHEPVGGERASGSAVVDIDETTEDAPANEEDEETENNNDDDEDDEEDLGDEDTQDTAEATTEEEGEILDDQEDDEEDDENDEPFQSPLKRAETESKSSASAPSNSGGAFSFKLKSDGSATAPDSSFKLPFTSPFSFGAKPKPFTSTSFGSTFGGSSEGSSSTSASTPSTSKSASIQQAKSTAIASSSKDKSSLPQPDSKKDMPAKSDSQKPSQFSFSVSSFGTNLSSRSITSGSVGTPTPSTSAVEIKNPAFPSSSKSIPATATASSSSSTGAGSFFAQAFLKRSNPSAVKVTMSNVPSSSKAAFSVPVPKPQAQQPSTSSAPKDTPNPLLLTFYPDTTEAQELFSKKSMTVEERYRILEARDKLIRARIPRAKVNVEQATRLIGTCPDMCPEKERYMRQFQRQLQSYETLAGPEVVVDHQKAVKVYSRSSADQEEPLPHELRPGPTLDFTMHYLLRYIVPLGDNPDENLSDWYNFLWDRTRSIRKDITQQQIIDLTAVSLYEKCTRFHIHCASRLCELDVHSFDPKLNDENLMKCLQSLEHLYEDLRRRQVSCPSEPEFRAYQIMMNLNEGDALYNAQQLPSWILNSEQVQTALKLHHSIYTKNFVAFFRMVENLPYMISCILHRYFFQVRSLALRCFMKAHCTLPKYETAMPMSTVQRMLGYGADQSLSFSYLCEAHGIHCDVDEGRVILKRKMFYLPENTTIFRETHLVDSKLRTSVAEAINGGPLPEIDINSHTPHSSFTENGQLIPGSIVGGPVSEESRSVVREFVPPDISTSSSSGRFQLPKPMMAPGPPPTFSFGEGTFQKRKEVLPPPPPQAKPKRDIETACRAVTTELIEKSVKDDVVQLSQARLEEARRLQEEFQRKLRQEQIASRLCLDYVEQTISNQVDNMVRTLTTSKIHQLRAVEDVSHSIAKVIVDESVLISLGLSARTELILAKEFHHRLLMTLARIFQRIRARFAAEKWVRYTRCKKQERERQEEKRRELEWNFPSIDSYSLSTKDVYKAFCGKSKVQPSINKADLFNKPPLVMDFMNANVRPKRKSDGDTSDSLRETPKKLPRLASGTSIGTEMDQLQQIKLKEMWDFPPANPYARTNRQVLEAFCGSSCVINLPVSPKMNTFGKAGSSSTSSSRLRDDGALFKMHKPSVLPSSSTNGVGAEIRTKASESISDLLNNLKSFVAQVREEKDKSTNLEPYMEEVATMERTCSELNSPTDRSFMETNNEILLNEEDVDWMPIDHVRPSFLSGVFLEEDNLLSRIRSFVREVKYEKARSWNTDTFLNNIDLENV